MPEWAHAFARRGHIVKMDNRDSDFILDLRFFNSLLGPVGRVSKSVIRYSSGAPQQENAADYAGAWHRVALSCAGPRTGQWNR